jgi:D-alanine--poly(phosphoribitol) ligase subunit 2|tara:strand:+ start:830 stop:1090 length:261 start_codon:yes stop_codon:yes gene_type:complete
MSIDNICSELSTSLIKLKKVTKDDQNFSWEVDLFDYGYLDSFGVVELLTEISKIYNLDLTNEDFYKELRTIRAIANLIDLKLNEPK